MIMNNKDMPSQLFIFSLHNKDGLDIIAYEASQKFSKERL